MNVYRHRRGAVPSCPRVIWNPGNYFEANNEKSPTRWKNVVLKPATDNTSNPDILVNSDILLNGAPSFHDGTSDWVHWKPLDWSTITTNSSLFCERNALAPTTTPCATCAAPAVLAERCVKWWRARYCILILRVCACLAAHVRMSR